MPFPSTFPGTFPSGGGDATVTPATIAATVAVPTPTTPTTPSAGGAVTWTIKVEVAFASDPMAASPTWTDVTAYVVPRAPIGRAFGRPDEFSDVQPGALSLVLDNADGRFTMGLTSGAYYPNVQVGKRIRVTATRSAVDYLRFDGHVNNWPTAWEFGNPAYAEAQISATDRSKRFGRVGELRSMLEEEVLRDALTTTTDPTTQLLGGTDSGFEAGLGNWDIGAGGSVAHSTAQAHQGTGSMELTADGTGVLWALNDANSFAGAAAVNPGQVLSITGRVRAGGSESTVTTWTPQYGTSSSGCVNRVITGVTGGTQQEMGNNVPTGTTAGTPPIVPSGTQTNWDLAPGTDGTFTGVRWKLRVNVDPSPNGYFWSTQGAIFEAPSTQHVWYCGLQSGGTVPGQPPQKLALFSMWEAIGAVRNTAIANSFAGPFEEFGDGYNCGVPLSWITGRDYTLSVRRDAARGAGWWAGYVLDDVTGVETWIGSLQAPGSWSLISRGVISWSEYFSNPGNFATCQNLPYSNVFFGDPTFTTGTSRTWHAVLRYLDSANNYVSQDNGSDTLTDIGVWTALTHNNRTVPSGVAKVLAQFETSDTATSGEVYYLDSASIVRHDTGTPSATSAAYYPLSEPAGSTSVASIAPTPWGAGVVELVGSEGANHPDGTVQFADGTGPGSDGLAAPVFYRVNRDNGSYIVAYPIGVGTSTAVTLECWFATVSDDAPICSLTRPGEGLTLFLQAGTGKIVAYYENSSGLLYGNTTTGRYNNARQHHLVITLSRSGSTVTANLYVDGVLSTAGSGSFTYPSLPTFTRLDIGGSHVQHTVGVYRGTLSHVAAYSSVLSLDRIQAHYHAGVDGLAGERTDERIARIADWIGIPTADRAYDVGAGTVGHQATAGKQPQEAMHEVEHTENGVLFFAGSGLHTFHNRTRRYNTTPAVTLTGEQLTPGLQFPGDDFALTNDMTVTRPGGSPARAVNQTSVAAFGLYRDETEIVADNDTDTRAAAEWRVNTYGTPRTRTPSVTVDLHRLEQIAPSQVPLLLAATIGTKLRLTSLPAQAPAATVDVFVEGLEEQFDHLTWTIAFNTSPADTSQVWQLGTAGFSELGVSSRLGF